MYEKDLVFIGGGHTHALAIRALAMRPIDGVRLTLISEQTLTPYSGMLPGFVAGHYSYEQAHIDLNRLCQWGNVRWIKGRVVNIDVNSRTAHVEVENGSRKIDVSYDIVSLDIGSTPDKSVNGAERFAVGVKPVSQFASTWNGLLETSADDSQSRWGVIGAGAGGVELVLAMAHRLNHLQYHLVYPGAHVLPGYPARLVSIAEDKLRASGIVLHPDFRVAEVTATGLKSTGNKTLELDQSIWCTGASSAEWLRQTDVKTSAKGFVEVDEYLRSVSHPQVFATGDCADMLHDPRPKAGVYAVRQAPFLVDNLRAALSNRNGRKVTLQNDFLSLVSLGDKSAVGCRSGFVGSGRWVWRLKDHIDTRFMKRLNAPGEKMQMVAASDDAPMHCAGCGSKLGPELLAGNLSQLAQHQQPSVTPALGNAEDASLWQVPAGKVAVQSIDGFRSFSNDLWRFGKICVNHALSDLYAMGAKPVCAQVWINLAFSHPRLQKRDHLLLMSGIADALQEQQTTLAGGHSTEGMENHVAVVANGTIDPQHVWRKNTAREGDMLVLTKPLGTGVVLAADMQARAPAIAVESAFASMMRSNRDVAHLLDNLNPSAVTDVTGFGLLGHLLEMFNPDEKQLLGAVIQSADVPVLDGALALAAHGFRSSLHPQLQPLTLQARIESTADATMVDLMLDPQTSGGLLVALSRESASHFINAMEGHAVVIGEVINSSSAVTIH